MARLSSAQRFTIGKQHMLQSQRELLDDTQRMNTGKNRLTLYEDGLAAVQSQNFGARIERNTTHENLLRIGQTELNVAETALAEVQGILAKLKEETVTGVNGTFGSSERETLANQTRQHGLAIIQLLNSRVGEKHLFSGSHVDKKTLTLLEGSDFASATYKEGASDVGERMAANEQVSVNLTNMLTVLASSASVTGSVTNPTVTGDINITVDDGNGNIITTGNLSFTNSNLATVSSNINTAFTTAGGSGAIAQVVSGQLNLNTSLITGNVESSKARVTINEGTSPGTALADMGLSTGTTRGTSANLMRALSKLEAAYRLNDVASIREAEVDLEANIDRLLEKRTELGYLQSRVDARLDLDNKEKIDMQASRASIDDIPVVEALNQVTEAQAVLNQTMSSALDLFDNSIFDFLTF